MKIGEVHVAPLHGLFVEEDGLQELAEEHALGAAVAAKVVVATHLWADALSPFARAILAQPVVPVGPRPPTPACAHIKTSSPTRFLATTDALILCAQ